MLASVVMARGAFGCGKFKVIALCNKVFASLKAAFKFSLFSQTASKEDFFGRSQVATLYRGSRTSAGVLAFDFLSFGGSDGSEAR